MSCASASRSTPPADFGEPDLDHLPRVVPFVDRGRDVEPFVALQPDELPAERLREHLGDLGLADARLAFEEQRAAASSSARKTRWSRGGGRRRSRARSSKVRASSIELGRSRKLRQERGGHGQKIGRHAAVVPPTAQQSACVSRRRPTARDASTAIRCARYSGEPCRSALSPLASIFTRLRGIGGEASSRARPRAASTRNAEGAAPVTATRDCRLPSARRRRRPARSATPGFGNLT